MTKKRCIVQSILTGKQIGIELNSRRTRPIKFHLTCLKSSVVTRMKYEPTTSAPRIYPAILISIHFNTIPAPSFPQSYGIRILQQK